MHLACNPTASGLRLETQVCLLGQTVVSGTEFR